MKHPAWIAADIIEAVSRTRGQIIDWADEIERGITTALDERDARIAELEARAEAAEKQLAASLQNVTLSIDTTSEAMERWQKAKADAARLRAALVEIQKHNRLHHDLDDYLFNVAEWGLGRQQDRPDPASFGLRPDEQPAESENL